MDKKEIIKELIETGGLPMELWGWQADYSGKPVIVEYNYLRQ
jgi:hypothetical protein